MQTHPLSRIFIITGAHIQSNLEHHKSSDVKRILEDAGLAEEHNPIVPGITVFRRSGGGADDNGQKTIIVFGDGDFVLPGPLGVQFYTDAAAEKA